MSKFVTKVVKEIRGRKQYEQLVVLSDKDDISKINLEKIDGVWDLYEKSLETRYKGSFAGLTSIMIRDANMMSLSDTKFKDVTPHGEIVKEYEIKYQDLRAYAIKIPNGKLILLGGFKNQQKSDFSQFRSIKKQYLESLKIKVDKK